MAKSITLFLTLISFSESNLFSVNHKDYAVTDFVMKNLKKSVDASFFGYMYSSAGWKERTTAQGFNGQEKATLRTPLGEQVRFTVQRGDKDKQIIIQTDFSALFTTHYLYFSLLSPLLRGATAAQADIPMSMDPNTKCWIKDNCGRFNGVICQTVLEFDEFVKRINEKI